MLKSLSLEAFGKFSRATFHLGPVTVFIGDNEAGKTTVFDALFEGIAAPDPRTKEGKVLLERYGGDRSVEPAFEGKVLRLEPAEFLNVYALRAGDLAVKFEDGKEWIERVKAHLFSGGIDPNQIRAELEKRASTKGSLRPMKELKALETERTGAETRRRELEGKRGRILHDEKEGEGLRKAIAGLGEKIAACAREEKDLKVQIDREEKIARRRRMDRTIALLAEGEAVGKGLEALSHFRVDRTKELDVHTQGIERLRGDRRGLESDIANAREALETAEREARETGERRERARKLSEEAGRLAERIAAFRERPPMVTRISWSRGLLLGGAAILTGSLAAAALTASSTLRLVLIAAGAVVGALVSLLARKTAQVPDEEAGRRFLSGLLDSWRNAFPSEEPVRRDTIEGLQEFLLSQRTALREIEGRMEGLREGLTAAKGRLEEKDRALEKATRGLEALGEGEKRWLEDRKVARRDEYIAGIARFQEASKRSGEWERKLAARLEEHGLKTAEELRGECDRVLRALDEEGVPRQGGSDAEVARLRVELTKKGRELSSLTEDLNRRGLELKEKEGVIKGSLGDLPEQILLEEEKARRCARKAAEITLDREAAQLAGEVFAELVKDAGAGLEELGKDLAGPFSRIVAEDRTVKVARLDGASIMLRDAGGGERPLNLLSSGTRDAFLFAARLALAKKAAEGERLLVLDEPFISLDEGRRRSALGLLKDFREETGWQVVILTKDRDLAEEVKAVFPKELVREIELGRS